MNILVADDEENILTLISDILTKDGHKVFTARDGAEALDIYEDNAIDMIILDEMMPRLSGNELVAAVRKENTAIPIIMVTAKGAVDDKKKSFDLGVDDYMVKKIDGAELIMRVNALARRAKISTENKITVKNVVLNADTHTITDESRDLCVTLTNKEFEILFKLLSYPEKVFSKWQLFNEFWGADSEVDDGIVKFFIHKIRKQIEAFPEIDIKTVMGVGYQGVRNEK